MTTLKKSPRRRWRIPAVPVSIVLLAALVLGGTYGVRKMLLRGSMLAAMRMEDTGMIAELAGKWPSCVNVAGDEKLQPLHVAARLGDDDACRRLIACGADLEGRDTYGRTPLHYAATPTVAAALLDGGAQVNARDHNMCIPLHWAVREPILGAPTRKSTESQVSARSATQRARDDAAEHIALVEFLILRGSDVNAIDRWNRSPLRTAIHAKFVKRVEETLTDDASKAYDNIIVILRKAGGTN